MGERRKQYFLFKEVNSNNENAVRYLTEGDFECGHYFSCGSIGNANFSEEKEEDIMSLFDKYGIVSILTKEDFILMFNLFKQLNDLGYGIDKETEEGKIKYEKGIAIIQELKDKIYSKLESEENQKLFEKVIEEEKLICMEEYNLSYEEITEVFEHYYNAYNSIYGVIYQDRGIISCVYDSAYEIGEDWVDNCYNIDDIIKNYIDFEKFGKDIIEDNDYYELEDERVISFYI